MFVLELEAKTCVYQAQDGSIVISQPDSECVDCGSEGGAFVSLSSARARVVAAALFRLADELDGLVQAFEG